MKNALGLLNRLLDALQGSQQGRRLLWFSFLLLVLLYWLSRRSARSQRPDRRTGAHVPQVSPAAIALSPGFHRIPVQQKVSVMGNDSIFDSAELYAIDACASSAAAASAPPALRLLPCGLASLTELARTCDLYVITQCSSDAAEEAVRTAVANAGVVDAGLSPHKILFCETEVGRGAMVRQLEPALHIDSSNSTLQALAPFVPSLVGVRTPANAEALERLAMSSHVTAIDDISEYFVQASHRAQAS